MSTPPVRPLLDIELHEGLGIWRKHGGSIVADSQWYLHQKRCARHRKRRESWSEWWGRDVALARRLRNNARVWYCWKAALIWTRLLKKKRPEVTQYVCSCRLPLKTFRKLVFGLLLTFFYKLYRKKKAITNTRDDSGIKCNEIRTSSFHWEKKMGFLLSKQKI